MASSKFKNLQFKIFIVLITLATISIIYSNINMNGLIDNLSIINANQYQYSENCDCGDKSNSITNYYTKYPFFSTCKNNYKTWAPHQLDSKLSHNWSNHAPKEYNNLRITRAVIVYFPIKQVDYFEKEVRWLYRSWINMLSYEPSKWRTDLIIFVEHDPKIFNNSDFFLNELNCTFTNLRHSTNDNPMCTLLNYTSIAKRNFTSKSRILKKEPVNYKFFLNDFDIFEPGKQNLEEYHKFIKESLTGYNYVDSILMAFDGYDYFKKAGYDFLVRSDMDVFLTPLFATWLPRYCNDFYVGGGGYSNEFNSKRFKRVANNLGLRYAASNNLGSTWYSTPNQVCF